MKRSKNILVIFIVTFFLFAVTSCKSHKTDEEIVEKKIQELIQHLEENNTDGIRNLFAKTKINDIEDFDASIEQLIEFYDGVYETKKNGAPGKFRDKDGDFSTTWFLPSTDVTTSVDTYRIAFYYCTEYTTDKDSIGIWSLYIIKKSEDTTPKYSYGGDGLWTPGINIGKVYVKGE
ncbi:MAG TPA: DUF5104 domain-containing protein [Gallicola sp.]|nr:DUF5104 domain-containing protein [Gallicola sp.]